MSNSEEYSIKRFIERPNELKNVPFSVIDVDFEKNKRIDYGNIEWLANSILTNGLKNPLVLYAEACDPGYEKALFYEGSRTIPKGYYRLVVQDGHRRYKAIQKALEICETDGKDPDKLIWIPCRGTNKAESKEERLLNQILMNSGKNFEPIELQAVFRELNNFGWTPDKIAEKAGCSVVHVKNMLQLSTADELTKYMIERGEISASLVLDTLGEVKQIAQLEGKEENIVYQELTSESEKSANGNVKARSFKQSLEKRKTQVVAKNDPNYFYSLDSKELLKRISLCVAVKQKNFNQAVVNMPLPLWEAIQARLK